MSASFQWLYFKDCLEVFTLKSPCRCVHFVSSFSACMSFWFFSLIFLSYKVAKLKQEMDSVQVSVLLTAAFLEPCWWWLLLICTRGATWCQSCKYNYIIWEMKREPIYNWSLAVSSGATGAQVERLGLVDEWIALTKRGCDWLVDLKIDYSFVYVSVWYLYFNVAIILCWDCLTFLQIQLYSTWNTL